MAATESNASRGPTADGAPQPAYHVTFVETPFILTSLIQQIRGRLREPGTLPRQYYRGEARLPVTEMRPWYRDLPDTLGFLFEKPTHPIEVFNRQQVKKRVGTALVLAALAALPVRYLVGPGFAILAALGGAALGEITGFLVFKKRPYPPDIFHDYRQQAASWVNSLLVHAVAVGALTLPFAAELMSRPAPRPHQEYVVSSIYLDNLPKAVDQAGGGGGGGARTPTPASKGPAPKFEKQPLAPPQVKIENPHPVLTVQPALLGQPDLKLPQMATTNFGDPQGVPGPPTQGPGAGGGIGTGTGPGIGSGTGSGLGPGSGGNTGGGPLHVGGGVSSPIAIYKPEPEYSEEARKAKYQGVVTLMIVVDTQGNATDIRVVKPLGLGLDEKAVEAVRTWKFKPAMRNNVPVPVQVSVEVTFHLF